VGRAADPLTLETLTGKTAAWSDRDSVGGFLLPMAFLREKGFDPNRLFSRQDFVGNYRTALEAVKAGQADVTSVFAAVERAGSAPQTGIGVIWPEQTEAFRVLAWTDEAPNDGVAVSMSASPALVSELERALLGLHQGSAGLRVISDCFRAERFELAPRMGYRALYRVALASL
jgi:phosphonate transport system substrate-binding protein